jgi:hypothetical protein
MKTIPGEIVEKVCSEMNRYSESRMSEEAARFLRQQPYLIQFLQEFTADFPSEVQQLSLYLAYLIWKICSRGWGCTMPRLAWEHCYQCFLRERRLWRKKKLTTLSYAMPENICGRRPYDFQKGSGKRFDITHFEIRCFRL